MNGHLLGIVLVCLGGMTLTLTIVDMLRQLRAARESDDMIMKIAAQMTTAMTKTPCKHAMFGPCADCAAELVEDTVPVTEKDLKNAVKNLKKIERELGDGH